MERKQNDPTLRELFEQRFDSMDRALMVAMEAMNRRLDGMNEFREALKDQASQMMTRVECAATRKTIEGDIRSLRDSENLSISRTEYDAQHQRVIEDIKLLRESKAMLEGKASQLSVNITLGLAVLGVVVSIISIFHHS